MSRGITDIRDALDHVERRIAAYEATDHDLIVADVLRWCLDALTDTDTLYLDDLVQREPVDLEDEDWSNVVITAPDSPTVAP